MPNTMAINYNFKCTTSCMPFAGHFRICEGESKQPDEKGVMDDTTMRRGLICEV